MIHIQQQTYKVKFVVVQSQDKASNKEKNITRQYHIKAIF